MTGIVRYSAGVLLLVLFGSAFGQAQEDEIPPFDVSVWLRRADHADFPWHVSVSAPVLTMSQRFQVGVGASISLKYLKYIGLQRDFHFVLKVADAMGRWIPEYSYTRISVEEGTSSANSVYFDSRVYLRPGRYILALIVFDTIQKKGNIWRKEVKVRPLANDPLPQLDRLLPGVEFIRDEPGRRVRPLTRNKEWLPVKNSRCLCVDIVANLAAPSKAFPPGRGYPQGGGRTNAPVMDYGLHASSILAVSRVLSQLTVREGRVRVSILDALRMESFYDREDTAHFDWRDATETLSKHDPAKIDAGVLRSQSMVSSFLQAALQRILGEAPCATDSGPPVKVIILVGSEVEFPGRVVERQFVPPDPASTKLFYFCFRSAEYDDLWKMLKQAKPLRTYLQDAYTFRTTLASLISTLESIR